MTKSMTWHLWNVFLFILEVVLAAAIVICGLNALTSYPRVTSELYQSGLDTDFVYGHPDAELMRHWVWLALIGLTAMMLLVGIVTVKTGLSEHSYGLNTHRKTTNPDAISVKVARGTVIPAHRSRPGG